MPLVKLSMDQSRLLNRWTPGKAVRAGVPMWAASGLCHFGMMFCRGATVGLFAMNRLGLAGHPGQAGPWSFFVFFNLHRPWGHRLEQGISLCSTMFGPRPCGATRSCACFLLGSCQDVTICEKCYLVVPIFGRFAARLAGKEQGRAELSLCLVDGGVEMRCPELS